MVIKSNVSNVFMARFLNRLKPRGYKLSKIFKVKIVKRSKMARKKKEERNNNVIIYDLKGTPYFIREEHNITEEDIDNDFLAEYDRLGFLNIADTQVRIYFGIDDNPKIWNQNPFLSHIIGETAYSAVIVFIDEAEFTEGMTKLSNDEFETIVAQFVNNVYQEAFPDEGGEDTEEPSPKFGFTKLELHYTITQSEKLSPKDIDEYFENNCMYKFQKEDIVRECINSQSKHALDIMHKQGVMYVFDRVTMGIDCYYHGCFTGPVLNEKNLN